MKQEEILDWMLGQGIVDDINAAKDFASAITQEQLDSFGYAPVIVVGCMWEGWKLAKKQHNDNKPLNRTSTARVVKDLNIDGYSLEAYGISVGDRVYIRDWDELSKTFEVSKDGVEWIVAELEESKRILDVGYSPVNLDLFDWVKPNVVFFGEAAPLYGKMYDTIDLLGKGDVVVVVGCSNLVINFNWDLFPILSRGIKMIVVNPDIKHHEEAIYSERGVIPYRKGSSEVWGDPDFITLIESYLN